MATLDMRLGTIDHAGRSLPALLIRGSQRRLAFALGVCAVFVAVGIILMLFSSPQRGSAIVGALGAIVFGLFGIFGLYGIARDVGRVALSAAGVHGGRTSELFVPWSAITAIQPLTISRASMVGLAIVDGPDVRIPRRWALGRSLSRAMYGVDIQVGAPSDERRVLQIAALIAFYAEDPSRRQEIGRVLPPVDARPAPR